VSNPDILKRKRLDIAIPQRVDAGAARRRRFPSVRKPSIRLKIPRHAFFFGPPSMTCCNTVAPKKYKRHL